METHVFGVSMRLPVGVLVLLMVSAGGALAGMNPANPGFPVVTLFGQTFDNNGFSSLCMDCHDRNASAHIPPIDNTEKRGNHFVYGGAALAVTNPATEKIDAWPRGGLSKYGSRSTWRSVTGESGEVICESCHNLVRNDGTYKLLAWDNEATDPSPLCGGCHGNTGTGHHLLTGETCDVHNRVLINTDSDTIRNPPTVGSEVTYPGPDRVNCVSCHVAHRAQTKAGGRVLKRGFKSSFNLADPVGGIGTTGLERQKDVDPAGNTRLVTDFTPVCDACHKAGQ